MRIGLLDLGGLFWTTYYGAASRAPAADAAQLAESHSVNQILSLAKEYDHIGVAFDWKPYRRTQISETYKANRKPKKPVAVKALNEVIKRLKRRGITMLGQKGEEADDMIASAIQAIVLFHEGDTNRLEPVEITIISVDKDLLQLVRAGCPKVEMRSYDGQTTWDEGRVLAKYGFRPHLMRDFLALAGDSADGIAGVTGVGEETAAKLLLSTDYTVLNIISTVRAGSALDGLTDRLQGQLRAAVESEELQTAYELVGLRYDAYVDVEHLLDLPPEREPGDDSYRCRTTVVPPAESEVPPAEPTLPSQPEPEPASPPSSSGEVTRPASKSLAVYEIEPSDEAPTKAPLEKVEWAQELEPRSIADAKRLSAAIVDSHLFSAYGKPQDAFLVIMAGREFGLGAMASLRSFHIVEGRPCLSAQAMMGLCMRHSTCQFFRVVSASSEEVVVEAQRAGWPEPSRMSFTIKDAQRANLIGKQIWKKYPRAMLTNRCIAEAARFWFPDVVGGLYDPEEIS